ncbi:hypothetical protein V8C86DRAFT_2926783 [Haematococcus lacustris]
MAMGSRGGRGRGRGAAAGYGLGVGKGVVPTASHHTGPTAACVGDKGLCHYCGKAGHYKAECRKRIRDQGKAVGGRGSGSRGAGDSGSSSSSNTVVSNATLSSRSAASLSVPSAAAKAACSPTFAGFVPAPSPEQFIIDSGASRHVVRDASVMFDYKQFSAPVTVNLGMAGMQMQAVGQGTVHVTTAQGDFSLCNVLHVPEAARNSISVSAATAFPIRMLFEGDTCELQGEGARAGFRLRAVKHKGVYAFRGTPMLAPRREKVAMCTASSHDVWLLSAGVVGEYNAQQDSSW